MDDKDKLEICEREAKIISRKFSYPDGGTEQRWSYTEFHELVNIGYQRVTADDEGAAKQQAYMWMLNFIRRFRSKGTDKRQLKNKGDPPDIGELIDLADVLTTLRPIEQDVLYERFWHHRTFAEISTMFGHSQANWASLLVKKSLNTLRIRLS